MRTLGTVSARSTQLNGALLKTSARGAAGADELIDTRLTSNYAPLYLPGSGREPLSSAYGYCSGLLPCFPEPRRIKEDTRDE